MVRDRRVHCLVSGDTRYPLGLSTGIFQDVWSERHCSVIKEVRGIKRDCEKCHTMKKGSIIKIHLIKDC